MAGLQWIHLTARMSPAAPDLTRQECGAWLWARLRAAFPEAVAVTLMPDHPHVVLASAEPDADRQRLARVLGQLGRRFDVGGQASRVPPAEPIRDGSVLARQIRYVALNPCREGLAKCPLAWRWSTHRDVVGASVDPWVGESRLARVLGRSPRGFAAQHHAYVSGDPHVDIAGTSFPTPAAPTTMPTVGLRTIAEASTAALREHVGAIRTSRDARALFIALAHDHGWGFTARLAEVCGCSARTIQRWARSVDTPALHAARLCLGDARLRR
jgi:hypothetical protein